MKKNRKYELTKRAEAHLEEIAFYGIEVWGEDRALAYLEELYQRFQWLVEQAELGTKRDDVKEGYRSWCHRRHVIFYQVTGDVVEILAVLHVSRDVMTHLRRD